MRYQQLIKSIHKSDFQSFINNFDSKLKEVFSYTENSQNTSLQRGIPGVILRDILECKPLTVFIPDEYDGRGADVAECLKVLEVASYHSLPLGLLVGINGALFLQPLALYGQESQKIKTYADFVNFGKMGGLMITEPKYGSDALHMQTSYTEVDNGYQIQGTKHWAGLTGMADYWLLTARRKDENGNLARDIDFFVHSKGDNGIEVEEYFNNLGLYMLPYGRNKINTITSEESRLVPKSTGVKMMLDILHRSRLQFPGMGIGFVKRMMDEAISHCKNRYVGGKTLFEYDQVQERLSKIQSAFTTISAMCAYTAEKAKMSVDLARADVAANTLKTTVTDYMQECAQSLLQLAGAKGYKLDHIAGKSVVDSRPFQIFEGSNDILYQQVTESVIKAMRRSKITNLYEYLSSYELSEEASKYLKKTLDFNVDYSLSQRKLVELGKALSRVFSMNIVMNLGNKGFHSDLVNNAIDHLKQEVYQFVSSYNGKLETAVVVDYHDKGDWKTVL